MKSNTIGPIEAIGTQWYFEFFEEVSTQIINTLQTTMHDFEQKYSRFISTSLLSKLNNAREFSGSDADFIELLTLGKRLYNDSDGVFNILIESELSRRGYDAAYSFTEKSEEPIHIGNPLTDIIITDTTIQLSGTSTLDFGGFGKGYLIDLLATFLISTGVNYFLINGGGDMYGTSDNGKPIGVLLEHPTEKNVFLDNWEIYNCGFGSSSAKLRSWKTINTETEYNHFISSNSISNTAQSYVLAHNALYADILATIALLDANNAILRNATKIRIEA